MARNAEEIETMEDEERHPLRFMIKFAVFLGLLYAAGRFLAQKKTEFADLTESQAREKLVEKMSPKVGDETASDIADQVIPKLKDRGLIKEDPMDAAARDVKAAADDVADAVEKKVDEASDKVTEAVDSVVKD